MENTAVPGYEMVKTLLGSYEEHKSQPIDASNNVTFLISNSRLISKSSFKNMKDIVCHDMGAWKHNGSLSPPEIMI